MQHAAYREFITREPGGTRIAPAPGQPTDEYDHRSRSCPSMLGPLENVSDVSRRELVLEAALRALSNESSRKAA